MSIEKIGVRQYVPLERIAEVLCGAVDPGYEAIHYWGMVCGKVPPKVWSFDERPVYPTPEEAEKNINVHYRHYYPLNDGGALVIKEFDGEVKHTLDLKAIKRGLRIMAKKYPEHFADLLAENDDNDTSDCLVQCSLFGEVIYG